MKKTSIFVLVMVGLFVMASCSTLGDSSSSSDSINSSSSTPIGSPYAVRNVDQGVEIIAYFGEEEFLTIPSVLNQLPVIKIGDYAFYKNKTIKEVTIPDSVFQIGKLAFGFSKLLTKIYLPESVNEIKSDFVEGASLLTTIEVNQDNPYFYHENGILYNYYAVNSGLGAVSFKKMTLEDNEPTQIYTYPEGKQDPIFIIPNGITQIGDYAFKGNPFLQEIIIPDTVTLIGSGAFMQCTGLKTLTIPGSISIFPHYGCYGCSSLETLVFSEGVTQISIYAFYGATSLSNLVFPESMALLGAFSFANIGSVKEVFLPNSVSTVNGTVFGSNNSLESFRVSPENSMYTVVDGVLYDKVMSSIIAYPSAKLGTTYEVLAPVSKIERGAFSGNLYLQEVTYAGDVNFIGSHAFSFCKSLVRINIPKSVTGLTMYLTYQTLTIEEYVVDPNNPIYTAVDGVLFNQSLETLIFYPSAKPGTQFSIPNGTTTVRDLAFFNNQYLERVTIPETVNKINGGAFASMRKLTFLDVVDENEYFNDVDGVLYSEDYTILYIFPSGIQAETFEIPTFVTRLHYGAFEGNPFLKTMVIPQNVIQIFSYAFQDCINLEWVVIPSGITRLERRLFWGCLKCSIFIDSPFSSLEFTADWNLDNLPVYYDGEWEVNDDSVPVLVENVEV